MLDELIWPADADDGNRESHFFDSFNDGGAEAAHFHVILKGDESRNAGGVARQHLAIEWLDEAGIDDCSGVAIAPEKPGERLGERDHGAEAEDGDIRSIGEDFGFADGKRLRLRL